MLQKGARYSTKREIFAEKLRTKSNVSRHNTDER
jgi:hypothetical protein